VFYSEFDSAVFLQRLSLPFALLEFPVLDLVSWLAFAPKPGVRYFGGVPGVALLESILILTSLRS